MGVLIGKSLHLTVRPYSWWEQTLLDHQFDIRYRKEGITGASFLVTC